MNETVHSDSLSDVPWPTSGERMRVPDVSMPPPGVRPLEESVSAAGEALHAQADSLRETRDAWADGLRSTVRDHPLAAVAAALAVGATISRLNRATRR